MKFSLIVVSIALLVAVPLGLFSGYLGGKFDAVLMRVMDGIMSFPGLVLVIAIVAVLGPSMPERDHRHHHRDHPGLHPARARPRR